MSLGLNDNVLLGAFAPEPRHKSAGLAFGLSLLLPGLGQFYCGKPARGGMTLAFWLLALVLCIARVPEAVLGQALIVMLVLWIFSFLDAYFTAIEINKGQDELVDVQNPRVAVTLNLLTAGFGYFYLGERTKGVILFVAMQVARLIFPATGFWGVSLGLALVVVQLLVAADAYRIARRQVKEALGPEAAPPFLSPVPGSRLPVQVPVVLACLLPLGFLVLIVMGLVLGVTHSSRRAAMSSRDQQLSVGRVQSGSDRYQAANDTPIPAVDLPTAVQDVQRVHRKAGHRKAEIPNLKQDVRVLSAALGARKIDAADALVAHYYRAQALAMMNAALERDGEVIDVPGARTARADLDKIIGTGTALTYVPEVSPTNAEYWAGMVARNQLHDEPAAYSYWEKCAANAQAGCMNILAVARVTGEGGQKVDVNEALSLHTSVYNTGVKYQCAGAFSAMNIAEINYFLGVRRAGDDELEWAKKADELLDKLEAAANDRNWCSRSWIEVHEFLFQLARGHRDDNILQDAVSRLDDDSATAKAVIQFISGAIDETGFNSAVEANMSQRTRCSAYFDAMWYAELRGEGAMARRFDQRLGDIGKFYCGQELVFAKKFKF